MDLGFRPQWPELSLRSGVIAYRPGRNDRLEYLLIRRHGHPWWSIPKGHPVPGCSLAQSATKEAYEEAGVYGSTGATPLGSYQYRKSAGLPRLVEVVVFPFEVEIEAERWPEMVIRERRWFDHALAADFVAPGPLRNLLMTFKLLPLDRGLTQRFEPDRAPQLHPQGCPAG